MGKMVCTSPKINAKDQREYPCYVCPACRKKQASEKRMRILHEGSYWDSAVIVDLTYKPEALDELNEKHAWEHMQNPTKNPIYEDSLDTREMSIFIRKLRAEKRKQGKEITYAYAGEYGDPIEHTHRPHWHVILFGCTMSDERLIFDTWGKSIHRAQDIQHYNGYKCANYLVKYLQKQLHPEEWRGLYPYKKPPIFRTGKGYSKETDKANNRGFGYQYVIDNKEQLLRNKKITVQGIPVTIPAYYAEISGMEWTEEDSRENFDKIEVEYSKIKRRFEEEEQTETFIDYAIKRFEDNQKQRKLNQQAKDSLKDQYYAGLLRSRKQAGILPGHYVSPEDDPYQPGENYIHRSIKQDLHHANQHMRSILRETTAPS